MSSCELPMEPAALPTQIRAASRLARSSTSEDTKRSCRITSASCSARSAFSVKSSGSPGPAPTSVTSPAARGAVEVVASSCCAMRGRDDHQPRSVQILGYELAKGEFQLAGGRECHELGRDLRSNHGD